jgi:dimethylargininase
MQVAITRAVSPSIIHCELTHLERQPINIDLATEQHAAYEAALTDLGCSVRRLEVQPDLPDSVFVEDMALVLDEVALILRSGAPSRRPEAGSVAEALGEYRALRTIQAPGTLDGGDVLRIDRDLYIGVSGRSTLDGIRQVESFVMPFGYRVHAVEMTGCLHLKSAVTQVGGRMLLVNPAWVDGSLFQGMERIDVAPDEPYAANALMLTDAVIYPAAHPATSRRLEQKGVPLRLVDVTELMKAEGAVTCCSLIFRT